MITRYVAVSFTVFFATAGCASFSHVDAKLDMAEQHMSSAPKHFYEGTLVSVEKIGPMTSLQFSDGRIIDVAKAPPGLVPGNIVRVYPVANSYEAHLWQSAKPDLPSAESNALAPIK